MNKSYNSEERSELMSLYENLRELVAKRQTLLRELETWYNSQVLGLVPKTTYKIVETTDWVKPDATQTPERRDQGRT